MKTLLTLLAIVLLSLAAAQPTSAPATAPTDPPTDRPTNPALPTLWIIGDSTVRNGNGRGGNGQWGWGDPIKEHFDRDRINVINRAIGGRSSRTFITEGRWDAILAEARPGDFVLIQFGHNDPGPLDDDKRARGSIRGIGEETKEIFNPITKKQEVVYTFGHYMRRYVREARAKGMTPIICSYIPRCPAPGRAITPTTQPASYQLFAQQIAEQEKAGYIDLFSLIRAGYAKLTPEQIKSEHFTAADNTHTSAEGARFNATKVVEGIRAGVPELAGFLK
jgi:rhamnogalacturonan acetylesterase